MEGGGSDIHGQPWLPCEFEICLGYTRPCHKQTEKTQGSSCQARCCCPSPEFTSIRGREGGVCISFDNIQKETVEVDLKEQWATGHGTVLCEGM